MPRPQGMELWRPDWPKIYGTEDTRPDVVGELLTVTRESLRWAMCALNEANNGGGYYDYAQREIKIVLDGE